MMITRDSRAVRLTLESPELRARPIRVDFFFPMELVPEPVLLPRTRTHFCHLFKFTVKVGDHYA